MPSNHTADENFQHTPSQGIVDDIFYVNFDKLMCFNFVRPSEVRACNAKCKYNLTDKNQQRENGI